MKLIPWKSKKDLEAPGGLAVAGPITQFRSEMDSLLDRFWEGSWLEPSPREAILDISETGKEFLVKVELPGVDPKDVEVSVEGDLVRIQGEIREESGSEEEGAWRSACSSFHRTFRLPPGSDPDKLKAQYDKGVLTLHLPKGKAAGGRAIPIRMS